MTKEDAITELSIIKNIYSGMRKEYHPCVEALQMAIEALRNGYEPITQTETQNVNLSFENRTMLDCYNCKRYKSDDACVECRYESVADTPQTDVYDYKGHGKWERSE